MYYIYIYILYLCVYLCVFMMYYCLFCKSWFEKMETRAPTVGSITSPVCSTVKSGQLRV